jgi:hypothetical protein
MVSIERLHEVFRLDAETGQLFWIRGGRYDRLSGKEAGCKNDGNGYRTIRIDGQLYKTHRVIFAMTRGFWPVGWIDHINMYRSDNRPENLREANPSQNRTNTRLRSDNTSGHPGVLFYARLNKWLAYITSKKCRVHIGYFDTKDAAIAARRSAAHQLHGTFIGVEGR